MHSKSFDDWLTEVATNMQNSDELSLLALSYMYRRHAVVLTMTGLWSTIEPKTPQLGGTLK